MRFDAFYHLALQYTVVFKVLVRSRRGFRLQRHMRACLVVSPVPCNNRKRGLERVGIALPDV